MRTKSMLPASWGGRDVSPFRELQSEVDKLFNSFTTGVPALGDWPRNGKLMAAIDVAETDKALEVSAEMPGVEEKDIDVSLNGDLLTIKAEKHAEKEDKAKDYHMVERSYGSFERSLRLPFQADAAKAEARFEKGVLKLVIPKPAEAQAKTQKITVKPAA